MNEDLFVPQIKESAVDTVIRNIKNLLLDRKLLPGDRLPNEQDLSKGLGVSRGSVREAMKILSAYGIIDIKVGDGTYIATSLRSGMIEPLLFSFLLSKTDMNELAQFRKFIEMDIAELIIINSDNNQDIIKKMMANVESIKDLQAAKAPVNAFVENEMEFHSLFGAAGGNVLMEKVYKFIMDYFRQSIAETHAHQDYGTKAYESHKLILDAILKRDPKIAYDAIGVTVETWKGLQAD